MASATPSRDILSTVRMMKTARVPQARDKMHVSKALRSCVGSGPARHGCICWKAKPTRRGGICPSTGWAVDSRQKATNVALDASSARNMSPRNRRQKHKHRGSPTLIEVLDSVQVMHMRMCCDKHLRSDEERTRANGYWLNAIKKVAERC